MLGMKSALARTRTSKLPTAELVLPFVSLALTLIITGTTVAAAQAAPPTVAYLQLVFTQSAAECRQRQNALLESNPQRTTVRCLRNTTDTAEPPPRARKLPSYLLELSSDAALTQPTGDAAAITVTYRAIGNEQSSEQLIEQAASARRPVNNDSFKSYQMLVFTNPTSGQEAAYNDWYDGLHVPDVLRIPGFLSGQRFIMTDANQAKELQLPRYLARFTLRSESLKATNDEITARGRDGRTRSSESFDIKTGVVAFFTADEK